MADQVTLRVTEERARALLKQCGWLLTVCVVAFVCFAVYAATQTFDGIAMSLFGVYWLSGVGFMIWLGRLAYGLGRSVVSYVGGAFLGSSVVFLFAHTIAYANIKRAVAKEFPPAPT
jgi:hypothetical protein